MKQKLSKLWTGTKNTTRAVKQKCSDGYLSFFDRMALKAQKLHYKKNNPGGYTADRLVTLWVKLAARCKKSKWIQRRLQKRILETIPQLELIQQEKLGTLWYSFPAPDIVSRLIEDMKSLVLTSQQSAESKQSEIKDIEVETASLLKTADSISLSAEDLPKIMEKLVELAGKVEKMKATP